MKFNECHLSAELLQAIEKLGYDELLPVQEAVIPQLLEDRNVIVQSKTGSGKTACYAIPEIEKLDWLENDPQVLVLVPTRELARQVQNDFKTIGNYKRINACLLIGQQTIKTQIAQLKGKVHVVVGTVGRVLDHIERGTLKLDKVHTCILDEADEMLNLGFIDDMKKILSWLPKGNISLFSATINEKVQEIADEYIPDAKVVKLDQVKVNENISNSVYYVNKENKDEALLHLLYKELPQQAIIFCNFRESVEHVFDLLDEHGFNCLMIHGGLEQNERNENMRDFKKGEFRIMVASDVVARGIDISKLSHVINYEIPTTAQDYVHRTGRSGRVDMKGKAINLAYENNKYIKLIQEAMETEFVVEDVEDLWKYEFNPILKESERKVLKEEAIQAECTKIYIKAGKDKKIRATDIVGAICDIDGVDFQDIGVIEILDYVSYVEILNNKGKLVLKGLKNKRIKNKKVIIEKAR